MREAIRQVRATGKLNFAFLLLLLGFVGVVVTAVNAFGTAIDKSLVTVPGWQPLLQGVRVLLVLLFAAGSLQTLSATFLVLYGLPVAVFLPVALLFLRKYRLLTVFLVYTIVLDLYFLSSNRQVLQLVKLGANGCVTSEQAVSYPVNDHPGVSMDALLRAPSTSELDAVAAEWRRKDFSPKKTSGSKRKG